jgi:hypothetical protein
VGENLDADILNEVSALYDVPNDPDSSRRAQNFARVISPYVSSLDCFGPTAQRYASRWIFNQSSQQGIFLPANQSGCLLEQQCNVNPQQYTTREECVGNLTLAVKKEWFCGLKRFNNYWEYTQQPQCWYTQSKTQQDCARRSDTSLWLGSANQSYLRGNANGGYNCLEAGRSDSVQACFSNNSLCAFVLAQAAQNVSASNWQLWDPVCNSDVCYAAVGTNQDQCDTIRNRYFNNNISVVQALASRLWFNQMESVCVTQIDPFLQAQYNTTQLQAGCHAMNLSWHDGVYFSRGQFNTPESCQAGICSRPDKQQPWITPEDCESAPVCTLSCPRCMSFQIDPTTNAEEILCYNLSVVDQNACSNSFDFGVRGNWNQQTSICSYALSTVNCLRAGLAAYTCGHESISTCVGSSEEPDNAALQATLGCQWNVGASCETTLKCSQQSQCNDWEFQQFIPSQEGPGSWVNSFCVRLFTIQDDKNHNCDQSQGLRQTALGCIFTNVTTQEDCAAIGDGYEWHVKATDARGCSAHGQRCFLSNKTNMQNYNFMAQEDCLACGNFWLDVYELSYGQSHAAEMIPLQIFNRTWSSTNSYTENLDWNKFSNVLRNGQLSIQNRQLVNLLNQEFSTVVQTELLLSALCFPDETSPVLSRSDLAIPLVTPLATCRLDPDTTTSTVCGNIIINGGLPSTSSSVHVTVNQVLISTVVTTIQNSNQNPGRRLLSVGGPNEDVNNTLCFYEPYDSVVNENGFIVGRHVGDCVSVSGSIPNGTQVVVCAQKTISAPDDNTVAGRLFTVPDFVEVALNDNVTVTNTPLHTNATLEQSIIQLVCAQINITQGVAYCPIYRQIGDATRDSTLCVISSSSPPPPYPSSGFNPTLFYETFFPVLSGLILLAGFGYAMTSSNKGYHRVRRLSE